MLLEKKDIIGIYNKLKRCAFRAYDNGSYDKCLKYINISAYTAYKFSWFYKDDDFENLLKKISKSLLKPNDSYLAEKNRYIFYDSFSYDNRGLTQQYVRALMNLGVHFLYITESSNKSSYSQNIFSEITEYDKGEIFEVPKDVKQTEKTEIIYKQIVAYKPSKLLMHLAPNAVSPLVAFYSLPKGIIKYQINLTDHAFWLGTKCLDYSLEFRPYGCAISRNQRNIAKERILLLPFYPIVSKTEFQGFPKECEGKVIVFSGGAYLKILGENNFFLNLVKQLLQANTQAIFLFAGYGDSLQIEKFISDNGLEMRFILLGHRTDINEVFKHCDIYLSTYPLGGGLMAQFAAINSKPIISYSTIDKVSSWPEETVCQFKKIKITSTNLNDFFLEAHKLISDSDYRILSGELLNECIVSIDKFNVTFQQTIKNNTNQIPFDVVEINTDLIYQHSIDIESRNNEFKIYLFKKLKYKILLISPKIFFWFFTFVFTKSFRLKLNRKLRN
jgi:hypothetical protein